MFDLFGVLRGLLKVEDVTVDDFVFKLHYRVTAMLLAAFSLIVTARQYIGDPIDCIMDGMPHGVADTYCWITATYTLPSLLDGRVGMDVVQPGVGAPDYDGEDADVQQPQHRYHKYYQWVCFVLFFQAMFFYGPRRAWKAFEGGRVRSLAANLRGLMSDTARAERVREVADYFGAGGRALGAYASRFFACELLNLANVLGQLWFLDRFLDGEFTAYGLETLQFGLWNQERRSDPMARVFPKVTMCTFRKYGPSGSVQRLEGLCVLPVNVVNEKIFVFLWFWLWLVAAISALNMVYRVAVFTSPAIRTLLLRLCVSSSAKWHVERVANHVKSIDKWFLLYQVSKNVESSVFRELIVEMSNRLANNDERRLVVPRSAPN